MGIQPQFIVARALTPMDERRRERFALFCNVDPENIIDSIDLESPYELPMSFAEQKFDEKLLNLLKLPLNKLHIEPWQKMVETIKHKKKKSVKIALVGKYFATGNFQLRDSYAALLDAIDHASWALGVNPEVDWISAESLEGGNLKSLEGMDGIIVPIGWGNRGVEGKINAIEYARTKKIPYLGLCYGMQLAVVEYARHVVGLNHANTLECDEKTPYPVIHMIKGQEEMLQRRAYGGTMRLGHWECQVKPGSLADTAYMKHHGYDDEAKKIVGERHRHRYEFNDEYCKQLEDAGLIFSGRSVVENLAEIIELPKSVHPFFLGTQYHPEYRSRPLTPHPIFLEFMNSL